MQIGNAGAAGYQDQIGGTGGCKPSGVFAPRCSWRRLTAPWADHGCSFAPRCSRPADRSGYATTS